MAVCWVHPRTGLGRLSCWTGISTPSICPTAALWQHDPYGAELVDGKIYGRGTSDMKGSVAAMVMAAAGFAKARGHDFAGTVYVSCTVHEECFEGVSSRNITKLCHPDCVIVGEATSTTLKIGQRGRAEVVLETKGKSCHSSNPDEGVNAVYLMTELIQEIRKLSAPEHPVLGKGILELTDIVSSPYPGSSVVPEYCRATFDRRLLVGETERDVLQPLEALIARVAGPGSRPCRHAFILPLAPRRAGRAIPSKRPLLPGVAAAGGSLAGPVRLPGPAGGGH